MLLAEAANVGAVDEEARRAFEIDLLVVGDGSLDLVLDGLGNVPSSALEGFIKEEDITIRKEILSMSVPRKNLERVVWKTCTERYPV